MKRKILTLAAAVVAIGGAFAGSSNAKKLLVNQGWYTSPNGSGSAVATNTASALAKCNQSEDETCLYHFNQDATAPSNWIEGRYIGSK